jgi:cytosine/creatinine deaminase
VPGYDLLVRRVRPPGARPDDPAEDIGVRDGRIVAIGRDLPGDAVEAIDGGDRAVSPGFVETHIHLDKSNLLDRCAEEPSPEDAGRGPHRAMQRVSEVKPGITSEDVRRRAERTLGRCVSHGCTLMRTHVEVDPKIGLRGFDGVMSLVDEWAWAIDLEICVMPQEGLLDNPGTEELMVRALERGARVVGAAPNYDRDSSAQIRRVFDIARDHDVDIDMHLDSGIAGEPLDALLVCDLAEKYDYQGRVTIGHVTRLSTRTFAEQREPIRRLREAGVAVTVLPSTDLYLGGRHVDADVPRNVVDACHLAREGVLCTVASNNICNPFTPFGDGQLLRQANVFATVTQRGRDDDLRLIHDMCTVNGARVMRRDHRLAVGEPADLVVLDAPDVVTALREIAPVLHAVKRGRRTVTRGPAQFLKPR